jgi:hypothetical protein
VLVHKDGRLPPEFAALWTHPTLLAIAQQLLVRGAATQYANARVVMDSGSMLAACFMGST